MPVEVIRYTPEELLHLRESPLIQKPDGLPAIEQWMEPAPEQNQRKGGRTQGVRNDDAAQANENGQRPTLFPGKHFGRHSGTAPEDIVLGPPKMAFASSSRVPKSAEVADKEEDAKDIRDKFFKDREERKNGALNGRRGREEGEGWTNVRGRKASFSEDPERPPRIGGRFNRDADGDEVAPRRNGARGRFEQPWGRDNADTKDADAAHGSWRERRDNRDREWARGNNNNNNSRVEEEPEWFDTPVVKKKDDIGMARFKRNQGADFFDDLPQESSKPKTQEDFQLWKEQMKAGKPLEEKENPPEPAPPKDTPTSSKPITPMLLDGKDMFGMWGAAVKQESPATTEGAPAPSKPRGPTKQSKFAKLFTPQEELPQHQQQQPPQPLAPEQIAGIPNGNNEDKEGFQRILQMLGNTSINTQSPSQGSAAPSRKPSVFSPVETRSPDRDTVHVQPQPTRHHILRSREEKAGFIESVLAPRGTPTEFKGPQGAFGPFSPVGEPGQDQMRQESRPESIRSPEDRMAQSTPGSNGMNSFGLQSLLTSQPPPHATQLSRDREFLLNLMTQPQRNTPPQQTQARPPPPPELFTNFMDNKGIPPRANPPPGLFEDRQFPENDVRYQPQPRRMPDNPEIENAMRRAGRFNLPVHVDDPAIAGIQRRNTGEAGIPRGQMNMGIPQQPPPEQMWGMKPPGLQQPQDRPPVSNMPPPPGFPAANNNNMGGRGPPGFGGPNNMPPFSAGNTPLGHPGMGIQRGPPVAGPPSAGPGPSPGMFSPPGHGGPPHGYFGPPQGPPPPPGFGGPGGPGPMGMGGGPGPHHEQMQQMLGLRGGTGGPPPGMGAGPGGMGMGMPGQRGPGVMGQGPGPNGFDFFENQRRGSHVQGPFGL